MKKLLFGLFVFILLFTLIALGMYQFYIKPKLKINPAISLLKLNEKFDKEIIDTITKYSTEITRNKAMISFAIIDSGKVFYYGIEREKDSLKSIDNSNFLFQIGSISKVFTSTILANLVVNNELKLDETIDKNIEFELNKNLKLKWEDLSNHTSGLDRLPKGGLNNTLLNIDNPYLVYTDKWMLEYLKTQIEIDEEKKGKSEYSNLGVAVLGNAMSLYKKMNYENLLDSFIFQKYNMTNSFVYSANDSNRLVKSYDIENQKTMNWELKSFDPAGGIVSNVEDLSKFILAQLDTNDKALQLTQLPTVKRDSITEIGLGWFLIKSKINHKVLFHNGATGNFTSSICLDLESQKGVIILSNIAFQDSKGNTDKLCFALLKYLNK